MAVVILRQRPSRWLPPWPRRQLPRRWSPRWSRNRRFLPAAPVAVVQRRSERLSCRRSRWSREADALSSALCSGSASCMASSRTLSRAPLSTCSGSLVSASSCSVSSCSASAGLSWVWRGSWAWRGSWLGVGVGLGSGSGSAGDGASSQGMAVGRACCCCADGAAAEPELTNGSCSRSGRCASPGCCA